MIITYHTGGCVRASAGDTAIAFSPVSKQSKNFKPTNFGTDLVFISLNHPDLNGADGCVRGDRDPFVISGPGEYEVKDLSIAGFATKSIYDGVERINTVYSVHFDGISMLYLGAIGDTHLPTELLEMEAPDVLIVPVGEGTLSPADAEKMAVKLEAKIVIPIMHDQKSLTQFLKEASSEGVIAVDKLTIKPKDVLGKENEVVVLSA